MGKLRSRSRLPMLNQLFRCGSELFLPLLLACMPLVAGVIESSVNLLSIAHFEKMGVFLNLAISSCIVDLLEIRGRLLSCPISDATGGIAYFWIARPSTSYVQRLIRTNPVC